MLWAGLSLGQGWVRGGGQGQGVVQGQGSANPRHNAISMLQQAKAGLLLSAIACLSRMESLSGWGRMNAEALYRSHRRRLSPVHEMPLITLGMSCVLQSLFTQTWMCRDLHGSRRRPPTRNTVSRAATATVRSVVTTAHGLGRSSGQSCNTASCVLGRLVTRELA